MKKLLVLMFCLFVQVSFAKNAQDFKLKGQDGKIYDLESLKGQHVVLEWYNDGCPFVKKHYETRNMQNLQKKYTEKGVKWFQVISSAPGNQGHSDSKRAEQLRKENNAYSTATLIDEDGKVGKAFEAKTTPHMFILNPKGEIVYEGAIDDKPSTEKSDVAGAKNYVALALDELLAGKNLSISKTKAYGCSVKY